MSKVIGIDLGTTNSCVSVYENGEFKIIPNKEGKDTTPSIVAFTDKGDILVGETAKRQAITNPEKTIESIKRIMGMMYDDKKIQEAKNKVGYKIVNKNGVACVEIANKIYTPQEISAKILSKLKTDAEEYLGQKVVDTVITVPAYFNDSQRKATQEAGVIAGLNVLRIINEPTAASLAYGIDKKKEEKIIVFDMGGGTHDVSLLEIGDGTFEVLATDGNAFLGGKDFDQRIVQYLVEDFKSIYGIDLSKDKMAMQRLMDSAENAKKELSSTSETEINLPFITANESGPKHLVTKLTKAKFESLINDLIEDSIKHIDVVLKDSNLSKDDINEIVMVGGSTRIPLVKEKVSKYFGNKTLNNSVNPDLVVAAGASIQGAILKGDVKDILLLDVTPLSLGLETLGNVMTKIIEKGTTIPVKKSQVFSTVDDNQSAVTIHVLQGEREFAKDNKSLGQFNLEGIPNAPRGIPQIEVTFDIDANGILTVSSKDKTTGKEQSITISGSSGLSKEEIDKMIKDAELNSIKDKEQREFVDKKNQVESLLFGLEKTFKEQNKELSLIDKLKNRITNSTNIAELNTIEKEITNELQKNSSCNNSCNSKQTKKEEDVIDAEVE